MSIPQTAHALGVSRQTVYLWIRRAGKGWPCHRCGQEPEATEIVQPERCPTCKLATALGAVVELATCEDCGDPIDGRRRRCVRCSRDRRLARTKQRQHADDALARERASHLNQRWRPEDDARLHEGTITEIAVRLGRTRAAVTNRRRYLEAQHARTGTST